MLSGIILANAITPNDVSLENIQSSEIPFILSKDSSYSVISRINKINIKTQPHDVDKISIIKEIVHFRIEITG